MPIPEHTLEITGLATSLALERSPARGLVLRIESGPGRGKTFPLGLVPVTIGSDPTCQIVIEDPTASGKHAEVQNRGEGVFLRDLGSTNGTLVGGTRVLEAMVGVDGAFTIGKTEMRLIDSGAMRLEPSGRTRFGGLVGESIIMREVFAALELVSASDATVLLQGPSGTGKEVAARAIHDHSPRASASFVAFDCGSVQSELLTSALMGHKKGAFTGAISDRPGAFAEADGGTLFLDEVGELPLASQTHLLRALETSSVTPVGADVPRTVDVRVVAATNRDLHTMVEEGAFRLDLFHRLAVVHVSLPALRDHLDDLPALIRAFYEGRGAEPGPITGDNLDALRAHPFAGNVRELRNILERSWVLSGMPAPTFQELKLWLAQPGGRPESSESMEPIDPTRPFKDAKEDLIDRFEERYLPVLMKHHGGNLSAAARTAGLSRRHLRVMLVKHGLVADD